MTIRINKHAWMRFGQNFILDGVEFWDLVELPDIPVQPDDQLYTVKGNDRLDLIANKFYRTPLLKWVIMVANDLEEEPSDVSEGDRIRIPSPRFVLQELFKSATVQ